MSRSWEHQVAAPPEKIFPLLCPVREKEWIPGWHAETVYLASGRTRHPWNRQAQATSTCRQRDAEQP